MNPFKMIGTCFTKQKEVDAIKWRLRTGPLCWISDKQGIAGTLEEIGPEQFAWTVLGLTLYGNESRIFSLIADDWCIAPEPPQTSIEEKAEIESTLQANAIAFYGKNNGLRLALSKAAPKGLPCYAVTIVREFKVCFAGNLFEAACLLLCCSTTGESSMSL
jgi:hypothetical protein